MKIYVVEHDSEPVNFFYEKVEAHRYCQEQHPDAHSRLAVVAYEPCVKNMGDIYGV